MIQSTSSFKKVKLNRERNAGDSDESDAEETPSFDINVNYESTKTTERVGPSDMGATLTLETETEKDKDSQSIFERSQQVLKDMEGKEDDKCYRGLNSYSQIKTNKDSIFGNASSGFNRKGPMRAPENVRSTIRWDYQPDICKDYKETGFCGFGDSCKFLHDRSDYKAGWQLELDHAKAVKDINLDDDDDDDKYRIEEDDDLPFKCFLCRESFVDPVVTKCKHYFCEKCALANYQKSTRCHVCGMQTNGVFNVAKEIIKRLNVEKNQSNKDGPDDDSD